MHLEFFVLTSSLFHRRSLYDQGCKKVKYHTMWPLRRKMCRGMGWAYGWLLKGVCKKVEDERKKKEYERQTSKSSYSLFCLRG